MKVKSPHVGTIQLPTKISVPIYFKRFAVTLSQSTMLHLANVETTPDKTILTSSKRYGLRVAAVFFKKSRSAAIYWESDYRYFEIPRTFGKFFIDTLQTLVDETK